MTEVGLYARISDDQAGLALGVARQETDGRTLAGLRGFEVAEVYTDNDVSAFKASVVRPAFERLLEDLEAGRIGGVVAYDLDRFARQPVDLERAIAIYDARPGLVFATVQGDLDLASADGRTMARVMVAFANKSSMDTARRVKRKHAELAQAGTPVGGRRPFGWQADKRALDAEEARLIREAVDYLLDGGSLHAVVRAWNEAGIVTPWGNEWRTGALRDVLRSPRLAGWRVYRGAKAIGTDGQPVRGAFEPVLDDETHERVLAKLETRRAVDGAHRGGARPKYLLTGLARCARCSRPLRGNARGASFTYRCDSTSGGCGKVAVVGPPLDDLITELVLTSLRGLEVPADEAPWAGEEEVAATERQIAELMEAFNARRLSSAVVFPAVERLEDTLAALREERRIWAAQREREVERPSDVVDRWPDLATEDRREILASRLRTVVVRPAAAPRSRFDPERVDVVWR